ncbi:MAG: Hydrolase, TatD family [Candidatus Magasanikbacteria bacterium GW2011_GWA2_37_8]|uniref:Hydrolase, TatD family n=1 Tax=Candidatus Magasanikbacteria bacterium GW2011_GWA2_37_8 TaxID=1619036 RepID=A0A0G0JUK5_9BACT|nr:MAG: Hydrolase, TatD family [Candidatus Magasanikbacteria bacterium GW2011_GWA2_37_8]
MIIDTHCHLQFNGYNEDREAVIKRCQEAGMICNTVGTQKDTSRLAVELAEKYDFIYATIGLHPIHTSSTEVDEEETTFQSREEEFDEKYYNELAQSKKVIAVGECGLELFHIPEGANKEEVLEKQKKTFLQQINFANKHNLPMVIHVRDAHQETIEMLNLEIKNLKLEIPTGVMHCYTSDWINAEQYLKLGFYLGFTGVITFPPKKLDPKPQLDLLEVVKNCPLDKILIETDSPYLAPQAYRGERAEPWMVVEVAKKIAEIRNLGLEEVVEITTNNAKKLFTKITN